MSRETQDLREFTRVLEDLAQEATTPSDLYSKLLSDASARLDDISAKRIVEDREDSYQENGGLPHKVIRYLATQWETLRYGPALSDPLARGVVDGLLESGRITVKQRRVINLYQMIRFQESGSMSIFVPNNKSYILAALALSLLVILLLLSTVAIWEFVSEIEGAFPMAYTLGLSVGFMLRAVYDSAWGREKIASYVRSVVPWLSVYIQE